MTGFGSSHKPEETPEQAQTGQAQADGSRGGSRSPHLPRVHLPQLHLPHLPHLHLPRIGADGEHPMLDALTHSLDLAGRGYCCAANPLEAAKDAAKRQAAAEGAEDAKLPGK